MVNYTEKWKNGELERGWYYVLLFSNEEYITFIDGKWVVDDRLIGAEIKEVLAEVPDYDNWRILNELLENSLQTNKVLSHNLRPFMDSYFKGLTKKDIAELAKKSIRLTTQHCKDNEEIEILREQLDLKNDMVDKLIRENESLKKWCEEFNALEVAEENQKLKELLEETKRAITDDIVFNHQGKMSDRYNEILSRIDEVLNEKL